MNHNMTQVYLSSETHTWFYKGCEGSAGAAVQPKHTGHYSGEQQRGDWERWEPEQGNEQKHRHAAERSVVTTAARSDYPNTAANISNSFKNELGVEEDRYTSETSSGFGLNRKTYRIYWRMFSSIVSFHKRKVEPGMRQE